MTSTGPSGRQQARLTSVSSAVRASCLPPPSRSPSMHSTRARTAWIFAAPLLLAVSYICCHMNCLSLGPLIRLHVMHNSPSVDFKMPQTGCRFSCATHMHSIARPHGCWCAQHPVHQPLLLLRRKAFPASSIRCLLPLISALYSRV